MFYFGIVENINDPENYGRVQVRVIPFYRSFAVEDLPWAYVLRSTDLGNTGGRGLNMHNLIQGSQVLVEFLDERMQQPIVLGVVPRESDFNNMQSYVKHELKFLNGSEVIVDETPGTEYIKVIDNQKNYILFDKDGITIHVGNSASNIKLECEGNTQIITKQNTSIETSGNTNISTTGDTTIDGNNITVKASGDANIETSGATNIKASGEATIEGSKLNLKNITGMSQLCCLKNCLFTGALHQSPSSD